MSKRLRVKGRKMRVTQPKILVVYLREDDPRKNTAWKMIRKGLAQLVNPKNMRGYPTVLDPYTLNYLGPWDRGIVGRNGLLVLDASWKKLSPHKFRSIRGRHRRLPPLLPGNPINYGKPCILSSIEAVAAALYITGYIEAYEKLLGLYKWMNTFHTLNENLLEDYRKATTPDKLYKIIREYWGPKPPC